MAYQVIIPAAGQGKRMGAGRNKLLLEIEGNPILIHTLRIFEKDHLCDGVILSISPTDEKEFRQLLQKFGIKKVTSIVHGGKERQHSVYNGLKTVQSTDIILVHDGARPFVELRHIHQLVTLAMKDGAAVLAVPVKDTIKKVSKNEVIETVDRSSLWAIQTPQAFRVSILKKAHQHAIEDDVLGTDEASLVERIQIPVKIVEGSYDNIKLTTKEDLYFAQAIMKKNQDINE